MIMISNLLPFQDVFDTIKNKIDGSDGLHETINKIQCQSSKDLKDLQYQKQISSWLSWCENSKNVTCKTVEIPREILKDCQIIDIKVSAKGPDDKIYNSNPQIREKVARGNTIVKLKKNGETQY